MRPAKRIIISLLWITIDNVNCSAHEAILVHLAATRMCRLYLKLIGYFNSQNVCFSRYLPTFQYFVRFSWELAAINMKQMRVLRKQKKYA